MDMMAQAALAVTTEAVAASRRLQARSLEKSYRGRHAVQQVSIEVTQGQVVGLQPWHHQGQAAQPGHHQREAQHPGHTNLRICSSQNCNTHFTVIVL